MLDCKYLISFHHHHHIALVAQISLTLSRHSSLSFIALGRSSGQHPVSSHSCWMYVRAGLPAFARPCVGIHKSTFLMSSSLLLQQCPACLVLLTWTVFVIGGRWPWTAINRLSIIWKSDLTDKIKRSFFQAAVTSILLYGCTTWTLTKRLEKKLDGNYTRMLRAILNKSWQQHPTRHQLISFNTWNHMQTNEIWLVWNLCYLQTIRTKITHTHTHTYIHIHTHTHTYKYICI